MNLSEAVKQARNTERKFKQTFDLIISLRNLDLKKPENRIKTEINLPNGLGKQSKICIIADNLLPHTRELENVIILKKDELEHMQKKDIKKLANQVRSFIAEAPLMPLVGKHLGQVLAPRNMMPKPVPASLTNLKPIIEKMSNDVKIDLKASPVVQVPLGIETMDDEKIAANAKAVISAVTNALPRGKDQIRSIMIKTSMGKPVKVSEW